MSEATYTHLLSPIQVGTQTYQNRVIAAPMGMLFDCGEDHPDLLEPQLEEIKMKCAGGIAEFCVGETAVSPVSSRWSKEYYDFSDQSEPHMRRYCQCAQAVHSYGAKAMIELCHVGRVKNESTPEAPAYGPSPCTNEKGIPVLAMTEEVIAQTCTDFANAARFMQKAGFDGVCLHAGHGWLPHQFLSLRWNQRTDRFGGSIENRSRISVMILDAIREACGKDFLLEVRLSGQENVEDGYDLDTIVGYCREIDGHCDLIHVSAGIYSKPMETKMMSTLYDLHGCNQAAAAAIKKVVSVPVAMVGGINNPDDAERWISQGICDLVVTGRQMKADPEWIHKTASGHSGEIRKCLRCMRCFPGPFEEAMAELNGQFPEGCSVNPLTTHTERRPGAGEVKKQVLVVGGGVAGMQAAITAAQEGHSVTLVERAPELGGILNFAKDDEDKYDLKALADSMAEELSHTNATVLLDQEATPALIQGKDAVICAIGSEPLLPPIPGLETTLPAMDAYAPDAPVGESVVMLGGGLVGCETAVHLAKAGKQVTLVEMREELAPDAYRLHKHKLRQLIAQSDSITVMTGTKCLAVQGGTVTVEQNGAAATLTADTVISALGMKARPTEKIQTMAEQAGAEFVAVGDCLRARKIYDAILEGYVAARNL
jgi:2,4-dienoyl-CoA reductase-like NADH-dependent reductase (Old Yellow Enzyme family)/thioredoxin reductase